MHFNQYEIVFQGDLGFSRKMMPHAKAIIEQARLPKCIQDNEGTELDRKKGHDLTIVSLSIGVRVRRHKYIKYQQFTQDDKERKTMSCDFYFFGYATSDESCLQNYLIFDGKEFEIKRNSGQIPIAARMQNYKHSDVWFNAYDLSDIRKQCTVYVDSSWATANLKIGI